MFKFTCKQGQVGQVVSVLSQFGKPHVKIRGGFPVVLLQSKTSNRKLNRALFNAGVPGAQSKRNRYKVVNFDTSWGLSKLRWNDYPSKLIGVVGGKMYRITYSYFTHCECCGPELRVEGKRGGKTVRLYG